MKYLNREEGISIVEVLASFIILSIILISFLGVLLQTKKTNASSETIQEATYLAQAEMEALYLMAHSKTIPLETLALTQIALNGHSYEKVNQLNNNYKQCMDLSDGQMTNTVSYSGKVGNYTSELKIDLACRPKNNVLAKVIIELKDVNVTKAKVENAYIWR